MSTVTLRDVAERCGVSTATVSAVVNGASWVSATTRNRVQRAVDEMGYRPNQHARSLKTQQGYAIGVVASDLTNPFFTEVVRSLSHVLREDGRVLFLCDSDHRFELGDTNLRMLFDSHIAGLVLIGDSVREEALKRYVRRRTRLPIVTIERDYELDGVNCLVADSESGAHAATRHLVGQGYQRVAMIGGPQHGPGSMTYGRAQRYAGYLRALEEAGIPLDPKLVVEGNFRFAGGQEAMRRLLANRSRPDAVFAANDMMALGAISVIQGAGLRLPDDIAVVGFDDIPIASLTSPGLTTVSMPKTELGRGAAMTLAQQISRPGALALRRVFDTELVVRQSSTRWPSGR